MKKAGLRNVEAFTIYQKAVELFEQAHDDVGFVTGLRQANVLFEQVIERVPEFSQVYSDHSDLFIHIVSDDAFGFREAGITDEDVDPAYAAAIADYEAAVRYARNPERRHMTELDLTFVSGDWRGLNRRIENALDAPGCNEGNWISIIADVFGYSERFLQRSYDILACDPRRSLSWFNTARSALRAGKPDEALRIAREGSEIAPGTWLHTALIRALVANGRHEEARKEIDRRIQDALLASVFSTLVAAHEGKQADADRLLQQVEVAEDTKDFWILIAAAWSGNREQANRLAAKVDQHQLGPAGLAQVAEWCGCGAPWEISATPNFAAEIEAGGLAWPPQSTMSFPLKDW